MCGFTSSVIALNCSLFLFFFFDVGSAFCGLGRRSRATFCGAVAVRPRELLYCTISVKDSVTRHAGRELSSSIEKLTDINP